MKLLLLCLLALLPSTSAQATANDLERVAVAILNALNCLLGSAPV